MTNEDLALIESDRADRWLVGLIQALVAAEMDDKEVAATGTFEETQEMEEC